MDADSAAGRRHAARLQGGAGVRRHCVSYGTRYTHSPIETVDERDVQACVDLIVAFATTTRFSERQDRPRSGSARLR
ncbi:MAG: hypothetical protein ACR2OO_00615 [Thermomicrobiales bacterium]